jgi:hypothetical protein
MKIVDTSDLKKIGDDKLNVHDEPKVEKDNVSKISNDASKTSKGLMGKLGELVKKAIDCCIE